MRGFGRRSWRRQCCSGMPTPVVRQIMPPRTAPRTVDAVRMIIARCEEPSAAETAASRTAPRKRRLVAERGSPSTPPLAIRCGNQPDQGHRESPEPLAIIRAQTAPGAAISLGLLVFETPRRTPPFQSCQDPGGWREPEATPQTHRLGPGLPYGQPQPPRRLGGATTGYNSFLVHELSSSHPAAIVVVIDDKL